ncbi:MAG: hypothetical protein ABSD89_15115, partial [Halobacteriota archaeon]
ALGNPAKYAGFPLFHRLGYGRLTKPDISLATKTGHFNLLTTGNKLSLVTFFSSAPRVLLLARNDYPASSVA